MFGKQEVKDGELCGFDKQPCVERKCKHWKHIVGKHPQTGQDIDLWDCAFSWTPVLMLEITKEIRQQAAAAEGARNEIGRFGLAAQELIRVAQQGGNGKERIVG